MSMAWLAVRELIKGRVGIRSFLKFWTPRELVLGSKIIESRENLSLSQEPNIAFVIHVFYEEYLPKVSKVLSNSSHLSNITFLISTSKTELVARLEALVVEVGANGRVALVPNIGRNFGPLFVEFSKEIQRHDLLVALHSKLSKHAKQNLGRVWANRAWTLFGLEEKLLNRVLDVFKLDHELGLIYPYMTDLVRPINLTWGNNLKHLQKLPNTYKSVGMKKLFCEFDFPVGGMFAARVNAIRPLLEEELTYDLFPKELGQLDGTLQHAIERALGLICTELGYSHAQFVNDDDTFYKLNQRNLVTKSGLN